MARSCACTSGGFSRIVLISRCQRWLAGGPGTDILPTHPSHCDTPDRGPRSGCSRAPTIRSGAASVFAVPSAYNHAPVEWHRASHAVDTLVDRDFFFSSVVHGTSETNGERENYRCIVEGSVTRRKDIRWRLSGGILGGRGGMICDGRGGHGMGENRLQFMIASRTLLWREMVKREGRVRVGFAATGTDSRIRRASRILEDSEDFLGWPFLETNISGILVIYFVFICFIAIDCRWIHNRLVVIIIVFLVVY